MNLMITLNNGITMPALGLGTWNSKPGEVKTAVLEALRCGYRHIDCAKIYGNEKEIGEALAEAFSSGIVQRSDIWVTSKLWNSFHRRGEVVSELQQTLSDLQLTYLDLYLVHWPVNCSKKNLMEPLPASEDQPDLEETWFGMIDVYKKKLTRSIGVSNFSISKLQKLEKTEVIPAVNQCELHPWCRQDALLEWCKQKGVHLTAYSPLGTPSFADSSVPKLLEDSELQKVAAKHCASPAQILIRWALERGTSVIPKSANPERIRVNCKLDFKLDESDMKVLNSYPKQIRYLPGNSFSRPDGWYKTSDEIWS